MIIEGYRILTWPAGERLTLEDSLNGDTIHKEHFASSFGWSIQRHPPSSILGAVWHCFQLAKK